MTIFYIVLEWAGRPPWELRAQLPGIPALHLAAPVVVRAATFREIHGVALKLPLGPPDQLLRNFMSLVASRILE